MGGTNLHVDDVGLVCFCSNKKFGDNDGFLGSLMRMLSEAHYQPKAIDDQLSGEIFTNVINNLDRDKHFLPKGISINCRFTKHPLTIKFKRVSLIF